MNHALEAKFLELSSTKQQKDELKKNTSNDVKNIPHQKALPPAKVCRHHSQKNSSTPDQQAFEPENPSSQHGQLHIRTRESPIKVHQGTQNIQSSTFPPFSPNGPKHIIDLTEDDDEEDNFVPRKKSRSSSDSSGRSDGIVRSRPVRNKTGTNNDSVPSRGYNKRRAISPPAYPFLSIPTSQTPSIGQHSSHSSTPDLVPEATRSRASLQQPPHRLTPSLSTPHSPLNRPSSRIPALQPLNHRPLSQPSHHVSSKQPARHLPSQSTVQRPQKPRQYASAVMVQSNSQLADPTDEEMQQRLRFLGNLSQVPMVTLTNDIDHTSPPTTFQFIPTSILRPGVDRAPDDVVVGCSCRKKRGQNECRYPNECSCLADSGGDTFPKRSQYFEGTKRGCLVPTVLKNRYNIYECNPRCDCSDQCKNRVVQWGRKISLEIFKTGNGRGWGLRCGQDLHEGQFVDTYRGEIITTEEADKRKKGANEDNYLFDFDKFEDPKYVCDGMHMGGPTRFMNHSCRPNCALFTVTYNHYDSYLYELAFFAMRPIPKGTELTFDYLDRDDLEGERKITEAMARNMEKEKGYAPSVCRCGVEDCRGYFFFSKD